MTWLMTVPSGSEVLPDWSAAAETHRCLTLADLSPQALCVLRHRSRNALDVVAAIATLPCLLPVLTNYANVLRLLGRVDEAADVQRRADAIRTKQVPQVPQPAESFVT